MTDRSLRSPLRPFRGRGGQPPARGRRRRPDPLRGQHDDRHARGHGAALPRAGALRGELGVEPGEYPAGDASPSRARGRPISSARPSTPRGGRPGASRASSRSIRGPARALDGRRLAPGIRLSQPLGYLDFLSLSLRRRRRCSPTRAACRRRRRTWAFRASPCAPTRSARSPSATARTRCSDSIRSASRELPALLTSGRPMPAEPPPLWDGRAAERVADVLERACDPGSSRCDEGLDRPVQLAAPAALRAGRPAAGGARARGRRHRPRQRPDGRAGARGLARASRSSAARARQDRAGKAAALGRPRARARPVRARAVAPTSRCRTTPTRRSWRRATPAHPGRHRHGLRASAGEPPRPSGWRHGAAPGGAPELGSGPAQGARGREDASTTTGSRRRSTSGTSRRTLPCSSAVGLADRGGTAARRGAHGARAGRSITASRTVVLRRAAAAQADPGVRCVVLPRHPRAARDRLRALGRGRRGGAAPARSTPDR